MQNLSIELPPVNHGDYNYSSSPKSPYNGGATISSAASCVSIGDKTSATSATLSKPNKQSGIFGASSNLINSIVGAGIIGIPYAINEAGLVAGIMLLVLVAFLTDKSLKIIVGLASFHPKLRNKDVRTFEDLAAFPFGTAGANFILLNMFVLAYGAMLAYLLIIKDTIPSILGVQDRLSKTLIMIVTSFTIMLPLSMQRDMASLSITSLFSVLADIILVGFITAYSPIKETIADAGGFTRVLEEDAVNPTIFIGLGILSTAMACQHSAFIVSGSLENRTMKRWATVTGFSIGVSAVLCLLLGVAGYLGFLDETQGNVLNNFDQDNDMAKIARFLLAITMFFTYPMECFVARHVMVQLVHAGDLDATDDPSHSGEDGEEAGGFGPLNRRQSWTLGIYLLTLLPALVVDDLGPVLSFTGSLGGGCIAYMGPGLVYLGVNGDAFLSFVAGLLKQPESGGAVTASDLPLAGDANKFMTSEPAELDSIRKPLWWYLLGFPVWTKIAHVGRTNMMKKVDDANSAYETAAYDENTMVPNGREFFIAIFFICFGVLSAIAGVASNMYVQLNRDDY